MFKLSSYHQTFILVTAILIGALVGMYSGPWVSYLKPIADIFLNFLICVLLPFVFLSVSHAVAKNRQQDNFGRLLMGSFFVFLVIGIFLSLYAIMNVKLFSFSGTVHLDGGQMVAFSLKSFLEKCVEMFSVSHFYDLWSAQHLLALILFAILFGNATANSAHHVKMIHVLAAAENLFKSMFDSIMFFAPLAFFSYFANVMHEIGANLFSSYFKVTALYYVSVIFYFVGGFTLLMSLFKGPKFIKTFWHYLTLPALTALGTCSSVACIPINVEALKKMGCQELVAESILPLGTLIHKQGSIIGGIFKIAFLFAVFNLDFTGTITLALAIFVSLMVGTVMGAIPGGGMLGELLILSVYGFPKESLILIAAISIIIDPLATLLNVTGNTVACLIIDSISKKRMTRKTV